MDTFDTHQAKTLVTGASGFLGRHLCRALRERGDEPVRVARSKSGDDPAARWATCDLLDADRTLELVRTVRPSRIFHLAGFASGDSSLQGIQRALDLNVRATGNLLIAIAAAAPGARVITAGTLEASALADGQPEFRTAYGASKQMVELAVRMMRQVTGMDVVSARIGNTYGPDEPNARRLVPHVILSLLEGRSPSVSSGTRLIDWIHASDVIEALLDISEHRGAMPPTIDIGTGVLTSVREVVETICDLVGSGIRASFGTVADRPGDGYAADAAASRALLGWSPRFGLDEGLTATVDWYLGQHARSIAPGGPGP